MFDRADIFRPPLAATVENNDTVTGDKLRIWLWCDHWDWLPWLSANCVEKLAFISGAVSD
jgi:hypothetical protein